MIVVRSENYEIFLSMCKTRLLWLMTEYEDIHIEKPAKFLDGFFAVPSAPGQKISRLGTLQIVWLQAFLEYAGIKVLDITVGRQ